LFCFFFFFSGGGIRGIAFGGALQFLEEYDLLSQVKNFAGSSAGAVVASGLAIGYKSQGKYMYM
jgi:NTE family protein